MNLNNKKIIKKKRKFNSKMFLFQASSLRVRERGVKQRKIKNIIQNNSRQNNNNKRKSIGFGKMKQLVYLLSPA